MAKKSKKHGGGAHFFHRCQTASASANASAFKWPLKCACAFARVCASWHLCCVCVWGCLKFEVSGARAGAVLMRCTRPVRATAKTTEPALAQQSGQQANHHSSIKPTGQLGRPGHPHQPVWGTKCCPCLGTAPMEGNGAHGPNHAAAGPILGQLAPFLVAPLILIFLGAVFGGPSAVRAGDLAKHQFWCGRPVQLCKAGHGARTRTM